MSVSGRLYLGRSVPAEGGEATRLELDPRDLRTHGFIVGMTGSGKTGLAIGLVEEALRAGISVLAIDPKGDLGNLLLLFDDLSAESFEPWLDPAGLPAEPAARRQAAEEVAGRWRQGLAEWELAASDVAALRRAHEATIYTPGSSAGVALNILQSLRAPSGAFAEAEDDLRDEIASLVSGLLALVGIASDPLQSREHILLSSIVEHAWREGRDLDLGGLLGLALDPPFDKLGALPLDSVYPSDERRKLAMSLNNLLASPSFEDWREGEPLDVDAMLAPPDGKPRLSIVHTAHLSDHERLFVTALVLDKVKTWMRRQAGTDSLRALVYMDEVFGYFPPHPANPPTKRPLLTLLKQARAHGVGVVLATQNPVDVDYKGLANMGVWLVGRLQTEQDRERLLDGLTQAGVPRAQVERLLDGTSKRVFLLHDVHRKAPELLRTRWAMSYLRGPLTRAEIGRLMEGRRSEAAAGIAAAAPADSGPPPAPAGVDQAWLDRYGGDLADPWLLVRCAVRHKGQEEVTVSRAWPLADLESPSELLETEAEDLDDAELVDAPPEGLRHAALTAAAAGLDTRSIEKTLRGRLPDKLAVTLWHDPLLKETSRPGEERDAFVDRLRALGGGAAAEKLRDRLDRKRRDLASREQELTGRTREKWMAIGSALLSNVGLLTGRKKRVTGTSTVLTKDRLEDSAEARVEALRAEIAGLEKDLQTLEDVSADRLEERQSVPSRSVVKILRYQLVWIF